MKEINLFITGLGNVGSELLSIIESNSFKSSSKVNIVAISNSKYMFFNKNGIDIQFAYIVTIKKKRLVIKHNGYYSFLLFRQSLTTFVR